MPFRLGEVRRGQVSALIAERTGLHFPRERWDDLERGIAEAAKDFGFDDLDTFTDSLLSAPPSRDQIHRLASHLTIGETYFFRDKPVLRALSSDILPELIRKRRGREQRLRLWSAACSSGEEAYSLAILVHQMLPDLREWRVTITATDINARSLQKAASGIYGEWSFRDAPPGLRENYFTRTSNGRYAIRPEIKRLVSFAHLNLVEDRYPSLDTNTNAMDIVFCRNVLMYFDPEQVKKVIDRLGRSLVDCGWLVVSPSEASRALFPQFVTVSFPGAIWFRKDDGRPRPEPAIAHTPETFDADRPQTVEPLASDLYSTATSEAPAPAANPLPSAETLHQQGRYEECVEVLLRATAEHPLGPEHFSLLTRALANQGRLSDALTWCERWIAADKMNAAAHYLRAVVLSEQGQTEAARTSFQRALYLDPNFLLAHFALGNLARNGGKSSQAEKHFANALQLLRGYRPDDPLPESEGLTAGRLAETITSIMTVEVAP